MAENNFRVGSQHDEEMNKVDIQRFPMQIISDSVVEHEQLPETA
jgi:hypothetical protein